MSKKFLAAGIISLAVMALTPAVAFAHVVVTPGQTGVGEELTFNMSVPNEQQTPVVDIKLEVPNGVTDVTPTTKGGWTITTDKSSGNDSEVTAIHWTAGSIPVGQRQDFSFSAQAPAKATDLDWKAYQTYGDGTVVHWDQKPSGSDDSTGNAGPYSITHVVDDLSNADATKSSDKTNLTGPYVLAGVAVLLSLVALVTKKK